MLDISLWSVLIGFIVFLFIVGGIIAIFLRRVVPTNMVHIVQSSKRTTPYGRGKQSGNTYYEFPSWVPMIGVSVTEFPESIFQIPLDGYEAYDSARLPFMVDVASFFRVDNAETAAQRVSSFIELREQLKSVVQGAIRRILATNTLEQIMEARAELGKQFTDEVQSQIKEWGVIPVKMIEFMDIRDTPNSKVIANIMEKEKSRIEMESRIKVAQNHQEAQLKEIDAQRTVDVQKQEADQLVGLRTAEKVKTVGIAEQQANQDIQDQVKVTTEKQMAVKQVEHVKSADIAKQVAEVEAEQNRNVAVIKADQDKQVKVVTAEAEKTSKQTIADGDLYAATKKADGNRAIGFADADAEKAMLMAPVDAQITLAKEIGENEGYQQYLITIKQVEAGQVVGIEMAKAMQGADLKVISNAGDPQQGIAKIGDLFTTGGGTSLTGMLAALAQTEEGKAIVNRLAGGNKE